MKGASANKRDNKRKEYTCSFCGQKIMRYPSQIKGVIVRCGKDCPAAKEVRRCTRCKEPFEVYRNEKRRVCSKNCPGFRTTPATVDIHEARKYSPKRRAIYLHGDEIDRWAVFEAHNWTCYICGGEIDSTVKLPDLMAATLDHIIPISKGGTHTWDNVAPAHAKCNYAKGASLPNGVDMGNYLGYDISS